MRRLLAASLLVSVCAALAAAPRGGSGSPVRPPAAEDRRSPFVLELPEAGGQPITAAEAHIPSAELTRIRLRVLKPYADAVDYGKIHTAVNGEAADVIFDRNADARGYVLTGDLTRWPRFKLKPGKNVIEISAVDKNRVNYYASYVLLTGRPGAGSAGATVESVPVAAGEDRTPPEVWLSQPKGAARPAGASGRVAVAGVASDDSGVVASVTVNGQPARLSPAAGARGLTLAPGGAGSGPAAKPGASKGKTPAHGAGKSTTPAQGATVATTAGPPQAGAAATARGAVAFEASAAVGAGAASVVVEARDRAGNLTRLTLPVRRREPAVSGAFKGRKFALVVGVSRYKHHGGGIGDLAYADVDARAVRDFLQSREGGGFSPADIAYLENEQATAEAVRGALDSLLPRAGAGDLVLVFVAGHGGPDPYSPKDLYFMLHDTKAADMARTALPMAELQKALEQRTRAGRLVVFVDTCHSAGLSGEQLVTARGAENNLINLYAARLFNEAGRAVLTSSDVNEVSQEGPRWGGGHGVFSWALLEGLRGGADANGDRFVTAGELFDYVRDRVSVETGGAQNPRALPGLNADLTLAVAGGK